MADPQIAIQLVLSNEGGFNDDPSDPGGPTNFGIALSRHPELTYDDIKNMTREKAIEIYTKQYWNSSFSAIADQEIANKIFDFYVNSEKETITILMLALQSKSSSLPTLVGLINESDPDKLLNEIRARQAQFYHWWVSRDPLKREKDALGLFRRAVS
jgi:hypothetical protein